MFDRSISLILVAAVVACPMTCGGGICHAGSCCAAPGEGEVRLDEMHFAACSLHGTASCCCEPGSAGDGDGPPRAPERPACQGVCGGAVFQRSCEMPEVESPRFLTLLEQLGVAAATVGCAGGVETTAGICDSAMSPGRYLRTLHASFLC